MLKRFFKKSAKVIPSKIEEQKKPKENILNEEILVEKKAVDKKDFITEQSTLMGLDMKKEVEVYSQAFFNSKNEIKANSYLKLQKFLESLSYEEKNRIIDLDYLDFKEKENQISTTLKNGFAQYLSKGSHLDEDTKQTVDMVFGDIKKLPSKGHRYWYYKIYIWQ